LRPSKRAINSEKLIFWISFSWLSKEQRCYSIRKTTWDSQEGIWYRRLFYLMRYFFFIFIGLAVLHLWKASLSDKVWKTKLILLNYLIRLSETLLMKEISRFGFWAKTPVNKVIYLFHQQLKIRLNLFSILWSNLFFRLRVTNPKKNGLTIKCAMYKNIVDWVCLS
jgi:hypothetical protein